MDAIDRVTLAELAQLRAEPYDPPATLDAEPMADQQREVLQRGGFRHINFVVEVRDIENAAAPFPVRALRHQRQAIGLFVPR